MLKSLASAVTQFSNKFVKQPLIYYRLGNDALDQGDLSKAEQLAQHCIQSDPQAPWGYYLLGKVQARQPETRTAGIANLRHAIGLDDSNEWFHYDLGEALLQDNEVEAAIESLRSGLVRNPNSAWNHGILGIALIQQHQYAAAIDHLQQATALEDHPYLRDQLDYAQQLNAGQPLTVELLLKHPPKLHLHLEKPVSLGISEPMVRYLEQTVQAGWQVMETGAGISTLIFAIKQAYSTTLVPDAALVDRIRQFGQEYGISTDRMGFEIGRSEEVLPHLTPAPLDLILIDGRHAFPTPFIDWYYMVKSLKVGGIAIVDDTQIWTGDVLQKFLRAEPEWQYIDTFQTQSQSSVAFKKLAEGSHDKWWAQQPYLMQQGPVEVPLR